MKIIGMVSPEERAYKKCFFCGETRSVKYLVEIEAGDTVRDKGDWLLYGGETVFACNKCLAIRGKPDNM